jgi:pyridoxamine 5'-phosphate oxidase
MFEPAVPLLEDTVDPDPVHQFDHWYRDAAEVTEAPEAMALATADADGRPSSRMVLLKAWGQNGFVFFTNYDSRKGRDLAVNPHASLLFYWEASARQVRIEGAVERTSAEESDEYFATRPHASQIGALASHQSRVVAGRDELDRRVEQLSQEYRSREVPRPSWWGGIRLMPRSYEFWQHRDNRLHDRICYSPADFGWRIERLQP